MILKRFAFENLTIIRLDGVYYMENLFKGSYDELCNFVKYRYLKKYENKFLSSLERLKTMGDMTVDVGTMFNVLRNYDQDVFIYILDNHKFDFSERLLPRSAERGKLKVLKRLLELHKPNDDIIKRMTLGAFVFDELETVKYIIDRFDSLKYIESFASTEKELETLKTLKQ